MPGPGIKVVTVGVSVGTTMTKNRSLHCCHSSQSRWQTLCSPEHVWFPRNCNSHCLVSVVAGCAVDTVDIVRRPTIADISLGYWGLTGGDAQREDPLSCVWGGRGWGGPGLEHIPEEGASWGYGFFEALYYIKNIFLVWLIMWWKDKTFLVEVTF